MVSVWCVFEAEGVGVGAIGDEEEWVTLYEEENEPDAQMLEIPNLTPYTHYRVSFCHPDWSTVARSWLTATSASQVQTGFRFVGLANLELLTSGDSPAAARLSLPKYRFRMKQVNIVGPSPYSQSSRVIQTLQAPPDVAPASITVRTASETSLRLRWVPLPDSQYNGNPESVGYRIKYWRSDVQSSALAQVVSDRLEREFTIEELEEWMEYELQMQAFNAVGAGPWSEVVRGRTRESETQGKESSYRSLKTHCHLPLVPSV
ncbi:Protein sidekick-1 [Plecturocebus cupreus]